MHTPPSSVAAPVAWPEVVRHVGSELALRKIELCTMPKKASLPLASLRLESPAPDNVRIALWGQDPEELLAERTLDLAPVPSDARLLSIAVAADELLATNFRELESRAERRRQRSTPAPPPPPAPPAPAEAPLELGLAFGGDVFGGGQQLLGADLRIAARLARRWHGIGRLGFRQGFPETAEHGTVQASAVVFGGGLRLEAISGQRLKLDVMARVDALRVNASAYPNAGAVATAADGFAVVASGGAGVRGVLSRSMQLLLDGSVGGALHALHITDTGRRVSGVSGLALGVGGGVLVLF